MFLSNRRSHLVDGSNVVSVLTAAFATPARARKTLLTALARAVDWELVVEYEDFWYDDRSRYLLDDWRAECDEFAALVEQAHCERREREYYEMEAAEAAAEAAAAATGEGGE